MRLAVNLGYWGGGNDRDNLALAQEAERLGFDSVWAAEAYGSDAATVLAWVAAQTERIDIGSAVFQIPARSPAMTAMTAATLDSLSGGRFRLGLGVSGPQVSVGWLGVRFVKALGLTREYVEIKEKLGPFDLIMLEVGAWHPAWGDIHLGPENALQAHALLGGGAFLPVHWGTFNLAIHAWDEPPETLVKLAPTNAPLVMPRLGQPIEPGHVQSVDPWWREVEETETSPAPAEAVVDPID